MRALIKDPKKIKIVQQTLVALKKVGDDLKLEIDAQYFVLRSLNSSNSALPVVRMHPSFFTNYEYDSDQPQILCQLSIQSLLFAFKNVNNTTSLSFSIDTNANKFILCVEDRSGISHSWELYIQETVLLTALYDLETAVVKVHCRFDTFNGVKNAFKGSENVTMEVSRTEDRPTQMILQSANYDSSIVSSLTIKKGESCDCIFNDDSNRIKLRFALGDFLVALKLASIYSQKIEMFLISPGHPIIIKSSLAGQVTFEIALATGTDEWPADDTSQREGDGPVTPTTLTPQTAQSQANSWRRGTPTVSPARQNVPASPSNRGAPSLSEEDNAGMRDSQILAMGLFDASPDYPYRRRITGQYAENSQPSSSESESD
ncbi:hypothetical protein TVAG_301390 [Trichomonas vaginalis G3]|uniref:DNA repair protein rad9 n=1 Tax=Trichomonas vaginalis (strain ATCC PRA-98 / G3) TaxID=412133 RepID=A2E5G1_TRIV3|nr:DNA repair protein RAD9 family [Trichomonas vaginalis G3]EAY12122.1 hypothetical protein TVAG_301390 [Trichomonas vaginalis G3]KAI5542390.1 DNA repair protein RAD9 family [Trichomonas vaginalis G3]|eukprot:XP_001324345.1 hypothetical protein [Trichomonas vaginalis G3]